MDSWSLGINLTRRSFGRSSLYLLGPYIKYRAKYTVPPNIITLFCFPYKRKTNNSLKDARIFSFRRQDSIVSNFKLRELDINCLASGFCVFLICIQLLLIP